MQISFTSDELMYSRMPVLVLVIEEITGNLR